jgi:hypothetical protein
MPVVQWYVARNQQKVGPFTSHQLKQLVACDFLQPKDMVLAEGSSKWVEAQTIPGLFSTAGQKKYWVAVQGQTRGPYVAEQIRAGLTTRQFTQDTQVWDESSKQWVSLSRLAEFRGCTADSSLSLSQAKLMRGGLEIEEAALHLAGKEGDELARLLSLLMGLTRTFEGHPELLQSLAKTVDVIRAKREEMYASRAEPPAAPQARG